MFAQNALSRGSLCVFARLVYVFFESFVKGVQHGPPIHLALSNHVELALHIRSEVEVHYLIKVLDQKIVNHNPNIGREQLGSLHAGVLCFRRN